MRGGYRKIHFQADHLTLLNVTQRFGAESNGKFEEFADPLIDEFEPVFGSKGAKVTSPESFRTNEIIIQSVIRHHLKDPQNLKSFLRSLQIDLDPEQFEVLGEKSFQEGIIDISIKERVGVPVPRKIAIEVKTNTATIEDLEQINSYVNTLGKGCLAGVLIAREFRKSVIENARKFNIVLLKFNLEVGTSMHNLFNDLVRSFQYSSI